MSASHANVQRWLSVIWWPLWPAFTIMVAAMTVDRACLGSFDVLPALSSRPAFATPLALLYVAAHGWLGAAFVLTIARAGSLVPSRQAVRAQWAGDLIKLALMVVVFVVDYVPMPLWHAVGALAGCRP